MMRPLWESLVSPANNKSLDGFGSAGPLITPLGILEVTGNAEPPEDTTRPGFPSLPTPLQHWRNPRANLTLLRPVQPKAGVAVSTVSKELPL